MMLRLPSLRELDGVMSQRVWLSVVPVDMRRGFDSLSGLARERVGGGVMSGDLFLFIGKRRDRLKVLYWDADGYALWYKRLEAGTFRIPEYSPETGSVELKASELAMLLEGIDLRSIKRRRRFSRQPQGTQKSE
jgi:transposase